MKYTNSNRGMLLEDLINYANEYYRKNNYALIYKKPTPIKINKTRRIGKSTHILDAFFEKPSTTDYNGIYKKLYLDFEAKQTNSRTSFPLNNISDNQIEHLIKVEELGGISFIIVMFSYFNEAYILKTSYLINFIGNKKSIPYKFFKENGIKICSIYNNPFDYLMAVDLVFDL